MDIIYLDFKIAFDDKVFHKGLLRKISNHVVKDKVLSWIKNWLRDKSQRVGINGQFSLEVNSKVPQIITVTSGNRYLCSPALSGHLKQGAELA